MNVSSDDGGQRPLAQPSGPSTQKYKDCLSCRIVGTGTLAGVGSYALWQSRAVAPGTPVQKRILGGLGIALLFGGAMRWFQCE